MSQFESLIQVWIDEVAALNTTATATGNASNTTTRPDGLFFTPYPADENVHRGHCGVYSKRESPFASPVTAPTKRRRVSGAVAQRTGGRRSERRNALAEADTNSCCVSNIMASSNQNSGQKPPTHPQRRTSPRKRTTPTQPPSGVTDKDQGTPTAETDITTSIMPLSAPSSVPPPAKAQENTTISNTSPASASTSASRWSKALSTTGQGFPLLRRPATATPTILSSSAFSKKTTGTTRSSRTRSRSPIKNMADLRFADIEMRSLSDIHSLGALPESTRDLIGRFQDVDDGIQVVPALIRPQVEAAMSKSIRPHNLAEQYHLTPDEALRELQGLLDLVGDAASCQLECQSELAWNALVHCRVFQWALAQSAGKTMKSWLTTTATIVPELAPRMGPRTDEAAGTASKMVDFCLTIEPGRSDQVDEVLSRQPHERLCTLNQTMYAPLRFRPVAVAVETKIDTAASTGETQLGIWTKAWLNRMSLLLGLPSGAAPAPEPPPLPIIRIRGHEWFVLISYLEDGDKRKTQTQTQLDSTGTRTQDQHQQSQVSYMQQKGSGGEAVDATTATATAPIRTPADSQAGNTIEDQDQPTSRTGHGNGHQQKHLVILSEQAIGNTRSVLGAYKLLKAIRVLADWAEGDFRAYIDGVVIPEAAKQWGSSPASASLCSP